MLCCGEFESRIFTRLHEMTLCVTTVLAAEAEIGGRVAAVGAANHEVPAAVPVAVAVAVAVSSEAGAVVVGEATLGDAAARGHGTEKANAAPLGVFEFVCPHVGA